MYDDRLEIESPGRFPNIVTVDNISYTRFSRNKTISRVMTNIDVRKNKTSDKISNEVLFEGLSDDENILLVIIKKAPYATQGFFAQETGFSLSKVQRMMKKL